MNTLRIIIYILAFSGSILCFVNHKKLPKAFLWLGTYLSFAGLSQIIGYVLGINGITNATFYEVTIIPFTLLIYFVFYNLASLKRTQQWLNVIFLLGFILVCFSVYQGLHIEGFSVRAILVCSMTTVFGSLTGLFGKIKNPLRFAPFKMGWLWVLMAFLFYYSSTFSYWIAYRFTENIFDQSTLRYINVILVVLFYFILLVGIIVQLKYGDQENKPPDRINRKPKVQNQ